LEDYIEALRQITKSPYVNLTVLDSVSSLVPKRIIEGDVGDATMALMARFWSNHLPEIVPHLAKNNSSLLMVSQLRNTLAMYGPSKSSMGGNALKYYNSIKVELSKKEVIKEKGIEVGCKVQLKNTKTKVGTPFVTKLISIYFPKFPGDTGGIDNLSDIVDSALDDGVIKQSGSMYTWREFPEAKNGEKKLRGKEAVYEFFKQNTHLLELLKEDLLNNTNNNYDNTSTEDSQEEDYQEEAA
jgi:recombination protein RecA